MGSWCTLLYVHQCIKWSKCCLYITSVCAQSLYFIMLLFSGCLYIIADLLSLLIQKTSSLPLWPAVRQLSQSRCSRISYVSHISDTIKHQLFYILTVSEVSRGVCSNRIYFCFKCRL